MFGNPCCVLLFKVCADLKFPLYHTSDGTFRAIRLIISASEQQERNKMNYPARNRLADDFGIKLVKFHLNCGWKQFSY